MSTDATRYLNVMPAFIMMLAAPVFILFALAILFIVIGPSVFVGLVIMVLYVPLIRKCGLIQKKQQFERMRLGDDRVRVTNEVITGIRVLKFYAWEAKSKDMVNEARRKEAEKLLSFWYWQAASTTLALVCPVLALVATFATYYWSNRSLPPISDTFMALSMFKLIQLPFKAFSEGGEERHSVHLHLLLHLPTLFLLVTSFLDSLLAQSQRLHRQSWPLDGCSRFSHRKS